MLQSNFMDNTQTTAPDPYKPKTVTLSLRQWAIVLGALDTNDLPPSKKDRDWVCEDVAEQLK